MKSEQFWWEILVQTAIAIARPFLSAITGVLITRLTQSKGKGGPRVLDLV